MNTSVASSKSGSRYVQSRTHGRYPLWESMVDPSQYGRASVHGVSANGVRVSFADGSTALDVMSGLWNANLGYGNSTVNSAISDALDSASFLPLFRGGHELGVRAARALLDVSGADNYGRVLFSTSGAAGNDVMMKLVRQYFALLGDSDRDLIVGLSGSWHGLTYGSFALTGQDLGQDIYKIDRSRVRHVSHNNLSELNDLLANEGDCVAAVVMEPVLGTGAYPVSTEILDALDQLRNQHGFLLVADEVACGFGRTGRFFGSHAWPVTPDLLITSKGLTNGTCAASAIVVSHAVCDVFEDHDSVLFHGETQAGSPVSCAAILASIAEMERLDVLKNAQHISHRLDELLDEIELHPFVESHRGIGCFRGIQLRGSADELMRRTRAHGIIVQPGTDFIMLVPALIYTDDDFDEMAQALKASFAELDAG